MQGQESGQSLRGGALGNALADSGVEDNDPARPSGALDGLLSCWVKLLFHL